MYCWFGKLYLAVTQFKLFFVWKLKRFCWFWLIYCLNKFEGCSFQRQTKKPTSSDCEYLAFPKYRQCGLSGSFAVIQSRINQLQSNILSCYSWIETAYKPAFSKILKYEILFLQLFGFLCVNPNNRFVMKLLKYRTFSFKENCVVFVHIEMSHPLTAAFKRCSLMC